MLDWRLEKLQTAPTQMPTIALFVGEGRGFKAKAPLLSHVDAQEVRAASVFRLAEAQRPAPGGVLVVEIPISMQANAVASLARDFTLNGFGVILLAPGGCNGLHSALGISDERLFIDGEVDLAPMVVAVSDGVSLERSLERLTKPNATAAFLQERGRAHG